MESVQPYVEGSKATKFIVNKVDMGSYLEQIERHNTRKDILNKLEAKRRQFEELALYEIMAKDDQEAALLLNQLRGL